MRRDYLGVSHPYRRRPLKFFGDVKRLTGREGFRLRVGSYRVIFDQDAVTILAVYVGRRATTTYKRN